MKVLIKNFFRDKERAQSAAELAIFGAILIFVIGLIVRSGLASTNAMNEQLKVLRLALSESYRTAEGYYHSQSTPGRWKPSGARNFSSFLLVEDRIAVDAAGRFSSMDRIPFVAAAGGTFSRNLLYPMEYGEQDQIPLTDVIINGQRFPFTRVAFSSDRLANANGSRYLAIPLCNPGGITGRCWADRCYTGTGGPQGCTVMYKVVGNYAASVEWCDGTTRPCTQNMDADHRFDINMNGIVNETNIDVLQNPATPDRPSRSEFAWEWVMVAGVSGNTNPDLLPGFFSPWLMGGVKGIHYCSPTAKDCEPVNTQVDSDGDFKEESVYGTIESNGKIIIVNTFDGQRGDLDLTWDDRDRQRRKAQGLAPIEYGLQEDVEMFSFTQPGTWLRIQEGQLLTISGSQFVRSVTRKDHADIAQRVILLTNDTGRFCDGFGNPVNWAGQPSLNNLQNPVEACNDCFDSANDNIQKTCMDQANHIIFVRSRIQDLRGRKWITRVGP